VKYTELKLKGGAGCQKHKGKVGEKVKKPPHNDASGGSARRNQKSRANNKKETRIETE